MKTYKELKKHERLNNENDNYYYDVRQLDRSNEFKEMTKAEKAARVIYLNKTCYNGLYRVNSDGFYNVPKGKSTANKIDIVMGDKILNLSKYFNDKKVSIKYGDFEKAVKTAKSGDVIYFDPPYDYETTGFKEYIKTGFKHNDLDRLKNLCDKLISNGCFVVVSNNDTQYVRECFKDHKYTIKSVIAKRYINCDGKNRSKANEVIIYG